MEATKKIDSEETNVETFEDPETKSRKGKFKIENQRMILTYKTHLDKKAYTKWISELKCKPVLIVIAHETGGEGGYPHTHVFVNFGKAIKSTDPRVFDYKVNKEDKHAIHCHIAIIKLAKDEQWVLRYLAKEDKDNLKYIVKDEPLVKKIWNTKKLSDALLTNVKKASDAPGIILIHKYKPKEQSLAKPLEHKWQEMFKNELKGKPPGRKIIWIHDEKGGLGKTKLALHLIKNDPDNYALLTTVGGVRDCATNIGGLIEKGWTGHCLLLDLARDSQDKMIYESLEQIANGYMTITKYEGGAAEWEAGWVVVLANFSPNITKFSRDRWDIRELSMAKTAVSGKLDDTAEADSGKLDESATSDPKWITGLITLIKRPVSESRYARLAAIQNESGFYDHYNFRKSVNLVHSRSTSFDSDSESDEAPTTPIFVRKSPKHDDNDYS